MNGSKEKPTFEFGLVMAGAISAGAYTAGVCDFLIEALDSWEDAKSRPDFRGPRHNVLLKVLTGASAGAMTSAIAAVALQSKTMPVHDVENPPNPELNRFYHSWVRRIDIRLLLGDEDIRTTGRLTSMLDSTELARIATDALSTEVLPKPRSYVGDPLPVFLTVANLRGVPYGFELNGSTGSIPYGMLTHADHMRFSVSRSGRTVIAARLLDPTHAPGDEWPNLALAALASGAFPIGLQPRALRRNYADYDGRFTKKPLWPDPRPADPYEFLCVDGGLMNNEPLELARTYLANGQRNPRHGEEAHRAVIMIDPFPNQSNYQAKFTPDDRLLRVGAAMFASLIEQARFKFEELQVAADPDVYSRFMISPSRVDDAGKNVEPAMASAILGGFGGFLSEEFRKHDFQLGRRNCQHFQRQHFCHPETNPLFDTWKDPAARDQYFVRDTEGNPIPFTETNKTRMLPIIPLLPEVAEEIPQYRPPQASSVDLAELQTLIQSRVKTVINALIDGDLQPVIGGGAKRWLVRKLVSWQLVPRLQAKAMERIKSELARFS